MSEPKLTPSDSYANYPAGIYQQNNINVAVSQNAPLPIEKIHALANDHKDLADELVGIMKTEQQDSIKAREELRATQKKNIEEHNKQITRHQWMSYSLIVLFIALTGLGAYLKNPIIYVPSILVILGTMISDFIKQKNK